MTDLDDRYRELAEPLADLYGQLVAAEGVDPAVELTEARLAGTPVVEWMALRVASGQARGIPYGWPRPGGRLDSWGSIAALGVHRPPVCVWAALALDAGPAVRELMARVPNVPSAIVELLAIDPDRRVRMEIAKARPTPSAVLSRLLSDPDQLVVLAAQNELGRRGHEVRIALP